MAVCATPGCKVSLTFLDVAQGRINCTFCMKREASQAVTVTKPEVHGVKIDKLVAQPPSKEMTPVLNGKQEVPIESQLRTLRRSNSMSNIHLAKDYVVASLRLKVNGRKVDYFPEFSSDPKKQTKRTRELAEMFSQTSLDQTDYVFPYDREEWALSCKDAEAQLLNSTFFPVKNVITKLPPSSRIEVEIHTNKGPCNGCKNRIERAAVAWHNQLTENSQLFVTGYYLQAPLQKVRADTETEYGVLGSEPEVSYGKISKESGLYVIQYWPRVSSSV